MSTIPHPGDALPGFTVTPTHAQLFCFSAVTWNPHRIHYDAPYARDAEGYPDILVQGPLLGALLMRMVQQWAAPWGRVTAIGYRSTKPVPVGRQLTVGGAVTAPDDTQESAVDAEIWVEAGGERVCAGTVRVTPVES